MDVIDETNVLLDGMKAVVYVERFLVKDGKSINKSLFVVQVEIGDHESSSLKCASRRSLLPKKVHITCQKYAFKHLRRSHSSL